MDLARFKRLCTAKKNGDLKLPTTNEDYEVLIQEALEIIANITTPIDLMTNDVTQSTLRWVNATNLIRKPIAPVLDTDLIDIDEQLQMAVVYELLGNKTQNLTNSQFFFHKRDEIIQTYNWNNFNFLQELGAN